MYDEDGKRFIRNRNVNASRAYDRAISFISSSDDQLTFTLDFEADVSRTVDEDTIATRTHEERHVLVSQL